MKHKHIIIGISILALFFSSCEKKNPELIESYFFDGDSVEFSISVPDRYNGIPENSKNNIIIKDYDSHEDGIYHIITDRWEFFPIDFDITQYYNFEIDCYLKTPYNDGFPSGGIYWDGNNSQYNYFVGASNGFAIGYFDNSSSHHYLNSTLNNYYNKFTIRRYDDIYYIFLNEKLVLEQEFNSFELHKSGFFVLTEIFVDYLYIKEITTN